MDLRSQPIAPSPPSPCMQPTAHNPRTNEPLAFDFLTDAFVDSHQHKPSANVDTNFFLSNPSSSGAPTLPTIPISSMNHPSSSYQHLPAHSQNTSAHHVPHSQAIHQYHTSNHLPVHHEASPRYQATYNAQQPHSYYPSAVAQGEAQSPVCRDRSRYSFRGKVDDVVHSSPTSTVPGHLSNRSNSPVGNDYSGNIDLTRMEPDSNGRQIVHQPRHQDPSHSYNHVPVASTCERVPVGNAIGSATGSSSTEDLFADPVALYGSLYSPNAPILSKADRRRLRMLLRARKNRTSRGGGSKDNHGRGYTCSARCNGNGSTASTMHTRMNVVSNATAAGIKDKKAARVIRNREVALRARQMAKMKLKNLENENCNLKNRASTLESENLTLRSYVQRLTGGRGGPLPVPLGQGDRMQASQWSHDGVTIDGGVVGGVPP